MSLGMFLPQSMARREGLCKGYLNAGMGQKIETNVLAISLRWGLPQARFEHGVYLPYTSHSFFRMILQGHPQFIKRVS